MPKFELFTFPLPVIIINLMEIFEEQKQKIKEVAEKYSLKMVLLFGSQAEGRIHQISEYLKKS